MLAIATMGGANASGMGGGFGGGGFGFSSGGGFHSSGHQAGTRRGGMPVGHHHVVEMGFLSHSWAFGSYASNFQESDFSSGDWDYSSGLTDDLPVGEVPPPPPPPQRRAYDRSQGWSSTERGWESRSTPSNAHYWRDVREGQPDDAGYWQAIRLNPWHGYSPSS